MNKIYLHNNGTRRITVLSPVDTEYIEEMQQKADRERAFAQQQLQDVGKTAPFWEGNAHYDKAVSDGNKEAWQRAADNARRSQAEKAIELAEKYEALARSAKAHLTAEHKQALIELSEALGAEGHGYVYVYVHEWEEQDPIPPAQRREITREHALALVGQKALARAEEQARRGYDKQKGLGMIKPYGACMASSDADAIRVEIK